MYFLIRLIAWSVWAVIGLFLWIPMLVRAVIAFNFSMVYATVTQNPHLLHNARNHLDFATILYVAGFRNIQEWTQADHVMEQSLPNMEEPPDLAQFLIEIVFALVWWGGIIFFIAAFLTP